MFVGRVRGVDEGCSCKEWCEAKKEQAPFGVAQTSERKTKTERGYQPDMNDVFTEKKTPTYYKL